MLPNNERGDYSATFLMDDGDIVQGEKGLGEWIGTRDEIVLPEVE